MMVCQSSSRDLQKEFLSAESFRTTPKTTYQKNNVSLKLLLSGTGGAMGSQAQVTRNRSKVEVPVALGHLLTLANVDWLTVECAGRRRFTYPDCHDL